MPLPRLCCPGPYHPHQPPQSISCWQSPILVASPKNSSGHRPIAVGEVLRRLISKCLASTSFRSAISSLIPPSTGSWSQRRLRGHHPHHFTSALLL